MATTPIVDVRYKQPADAKLFDMEFGGEMTRSETIASISSIAATRITGTGTVTLTLGTPTYAGTRVQVLISLGVDGETYKVTVKVVTSTGQTIEGEGILHVREK